MSQSTTVALSDAAITSLSNNRPGRYEYHHTNALGSNIVLTDDRKNVIARYEYDVFGALRVETGTSDNTRKFTGKEYGKVDILAKKSHSLMASTFALKMLQIAGATG